MRFIRRNWAVAAIFTAGIALGVGSCVDGNPMRSLSPQIRKVNGPLPSTATYFVGSQATNADSTYGALPYTATGATLLPGTVARIHAEGDLILTGNPNCAVTPPTVLIPPPGQGLGEGKVQVAFARDIVGNSTQWNADGNGYVIHLGASNPYDTTGVSIMASRQGVGSGCFNRDTVGIYNYNLSGGTTLTIDILGVTVTPSATSVQPGQSVHFTTAPINFAQTGAITWSLDTAAYQTYKPHIQVSSCTNLVVCDYMPPKSGRMEVCMNDEQNYPVCGQSSQITVAAWINGAPPCRSRPIPWYSRISLRYDSTDLHHKLPHMGQDYADTTGTPASAVDSGRVIYAGWAGTAGYTVAVRSALPDARGLLLDTYFFHLNKGTIVVQDGQPVSAGQFLGSSDDSGQFKDGKPSSFGSHLHIEQHVQTSAGAFPNQGHNDRATLVVPCTF